jgi:quercetin dioxygenase-like cupin family protein
MPKSTVVVQNLEEIPLRDPPRDYARIKMLCDPRNAEHLLVGYMWWKPLSKGGMHYHDVEELQLILYGNGRLTDCDGNQYPLRAGTMFLCPPGEGGAHQIENPSQFPMCLLFVYPTQDFQTEQCQP